MKEQIYTIPVTEAFGMECECPLCELERKLENDYIDYMLGPSLMEPDCRQDTNENGFCRRHFEMLFNSRKNSLGLGLMLATHMAEQAKALEKITASRLSALESEAGMPFLKNLTASVTSPKKQASGLLAEDILSWLDALEKSCSICCRIDRTMDRYMDVIAYLWSEEQDFRNLFRKKKGFCLKHLRLLVDGARKYVGARDRALFLRELLEMQSKNMKRHIDEVDWFTKKFDYRYNDAPWNNSKDAVPRALQKLAGYCRLE